MTSLLSRAFEYYGFIGQIVVAGKAPKTKKWLMSFKIVLHSWNQFTGNIFSRKDGVVWSVKGDVKCRDFNTL